MRISRFLLVLQPSPQVCRGVTVLTNLEKIIALYIIFED